jgi:hypothetical protein
MLAQNVAAVVCRNETWQGQAATEPYECGWAKEAIIFVRALKPPALPVGAPRPRADQRRWHELGR